MISRCLLPLWCLLPTCQAASAADRATVFVATEGGTAVIPLRSWRERRDDGIVKQRLDYSCGSAAIATILSGYYGVPATEATILEAIDRGTMRATFEAMQQGVAKLGFRAVGMAASFAQLRRLRMPVIVYLRFRRRDHFSVIRGMDDRHILLADPSLGNRRFTHAQFRQSWETRDAAMAGKVLAIFPETRTPAVNDGYFRTDVGAGLATRVRNQVLPSIGGP